MARKITSLILMLAACVSMQVMELTPHHHHGNEVIFAAAGDCADAGLSETADCCCGHDHPARDHAGCSGCPPGTQDTECCIKMVYVAQEVAQHLAGVAFAAHCAVELFDYDPFAGHNLVPVSVWPERPCFAKPLPDRFVIEPGGLRAPPVVA